MLHSFHEIENPFYEIENPFYEIENPFHEIEIPLRISACSHQIHIFALFVGFPANSLFILISQDKLKLSWEL